MRDVEAPGPDWLEGPENLEQEENQGREVPPTRCRTEAWSCCPFDVRVFLYAPSVTGRSWAETRAGGRARAPSRSRRSATGSQASTFTFRRPRGLCASEPRPAQLALPQPRQRPGGPAWVGAPREKLSSWAVALACGGPRSGRREPLGEVWPCARAQMRGWGPAGTPGGTSVCPLNPPSPGQPLPCGQRARGRCALALGPPFLLVPDTAHRKDPGERGGGFSVGHLKEGALPCRSRRRLP